MKTKGGGEGEEEENKGQIAHSRKLVLFIDSHIKGVLVNQYMFSTAGI